MGSRSVAILVVGEPSRDIRVQKHAYTLQKAGYEVTSFCVLNSTGLPLTEQTAYGTVVRIVPDDSANSSAQAAEPSTPPPGQLATSTQDRTREPLKPRVMHALRRRVRTLRDIDVLRAMLRVNRTLAEVVLRTSPDVVISCDLNTLPGGLSAAKRSSALHVYDAHELFAESDPDMDPALRAMLTSLEAVLIRRTDLVVTVSNPLADVLSSRYRVPTPLVIRNVPLARVSEVSPAHQPVRLLYQGAFTADRNLIALVSAMHELRGRVVLSLQGFGPLEAELLATAEAEGLNDCVRFLEPCAPLETVEEASKHDIGMIMLAPTSLNNTLSAPNKLHDYMAAGLAIAGAGMPYIRQLIEACGCGSTFDPRKPESLVQIVHAMISDPEELDRQKRNAWLASASHLWEVESAPLIRRIGRFLGE